MMVTFWLVVSREGLEGSFTTRAEAVDYMNELRGIGVSGLRIQQKDIDHG